jgi:transcription initiation factor TFIIIB Brf1 subunit/transcription initiation factor TFIIB
MSNFELFENALNEFNKINNTNGYCNDDSDEEELKGEKIEYDLCDHIILSNDNGITSCLECGKEVEKNMFHDKEWRYYGQSDNKRTSDPNRVHIRKNEERTIFKDVENMGFGDKIVSLANQIYLQVTDGQIFRGNHRKAIIFASIYHAFKLNGKPQSHEKLIRIFELNRKLGLKGLKYISLHAPKESNIHVTYITPANIIDDIMDKFRATDEQKKEVIGLYNKIKNKSSKINRSRPQSISAGITYYWVSTKNIDISLKEFAKKVELSELTISKIAKEIAVVLKATPESWL